MINFIAWGRAINKIKWLPIPYFKYENVRGYESLKTAGKVAETLALHKLYCG